MLRSLAALAIGVSAALTAPAFAFDNYHLTREIPVAGPVSGWDYLSFDDATSRLFVGRRGEGLQVFDTAHDFAASTVDKTKGSNGATLIPDFGLGVSYNGSAGTLTVFKLADLSVQREIKVADALDSARYDPVTKRLAVFGIDSADGKGQDVAVFSVPDFEKVGTIKVDSSGLEASVPDGKGAILVNAQDRDSVQRLDMKALSVAGSYPTTGCTQPTGMAIDAASRRLFIGCRGHLTAPAFLVLNADTGAVVFTTPIVAGNDGVAYDATRKRVILTNGVGAALFVFEQTDPDTYALGEVVGTRANVRTVAVDPKTGRIYSAAGEGLVDPAKKILTRVSPFYANTFSPDSFRIFQYGS
jgi:hypothetical protein